MSAISKAIPVSANERTKRLLKAVAGGFIKKGLSCHFEVGLTAWGGRRADIVAMTTKRIITIVEVKQCWSDFQRDNKYPDYLEHCHKFYFAFPHDMWATYSERLLAAIPKGIGVIVLGTGGHTSILKNAKTREITHDAVRQLVTKLAWRSGVHRGNTKRTRVYLD